MLSSFFLVLYNFWLYLRFVSDKSSFYFLKTNNIKNFSKFNDSLNIAIHDFQFSIEIVGLIFTLLVYIVGLISVLSLDTRLYWKNIRLVFVCYFLVFAVVIFCSTSDLLVLFLAYEALLVPSFLFVYYIAPNRRAVQASVYFLI
jgi:formate hydrogenlyase subunit 3/multisubunit Na+/H+ antiporter MnhD subunit